MREKIVLVGAGSASFTRGLLADLVSQNVECDLALVDVDPQALEVAQRLALKMIEARKAPVTLSASTDRRDVLTGATAVICTVGVGGRRAWEQDVFIPREHGMFQPVGDSVMPGGTSRALRMIPAMVGVAEDVLDLAPQALFFNYGNPMAPICRGIRKATGAQVVGLCHGVNMVVHYLSHALGISADRLGYTAAGMNHLTWFTEVRVDGQDAMPRLLAMADERTEQGSEPFSWELLKLFGAFPAVLDRHVTEFFTSIFSSGDYYGKKLGIDAFSFEETISGGDAIFEEMKRDAFSPDPLGEDYFERISGEHEQVLEIVQSIRADSGRIFSANLPNKGQIPNLPANAIVECPAVATADGLRPIQLPPLSPALVGTLATRLAWVETTVDAALEGSRRKFVQALVIDGAVSSIDMAEQLADELLEAQKDYLPQFKV